MKHLTSYNNYWGTKGEKRRGEGKATTTKEGDAVWKKCIIQFGI